MIYAVENPGYPKIAQVYQSNRVAYCPVAMDCEGIDIDAIEQARANVVHISPAHHFPTGIITPISRRYELLGWASKAANRYIVEDDFDSEFRMLGKPIPPLLSIDQSDKVIYMNTFSKSLASTIRISYMVLPLSLMAMFQTKLGFYSCTVSTFEQYTLSRFIEDGYFEMHINRMRTYYRNLRNEFIEKIKASPLGAKVIIAEENSGLHFLLKVATARDDKEVIKAAAKRGMNISSLGQYYEKNSICPDDVLHTFVINYSSLRQNQITKAIEVLTDILDI